MYKKALQISPTLLVLAYELSTGEYALAFCYVGYQPMWENELEFFKLADLESIMNEFEPIHNWSEKLFDKSVNTKRKVIFNPSPVF